MVIGCGQMAPIKFGTSYKKKGPSSVPVHTPNLQVVVRERVGISKLTPHGLEHKDVHIKISISIYKPPLKEIRKGNKFSVLQQISASFLHIRVYLSTKT